MSTFDPRLFAKRRSIGSTVALKLYDGWKLKLMGQLEEATRKGAEALALEQSFDGVKVSEPKTEDDGVSLNKSHTFRPTDLADFIAGRMDKAAPPVEAAPVAEKAPPKRGRSKAEERADAPLVGVNGTAS